MWQELMDVMERLGQLYRELAALEQKKNSALVAVDLPEIDALTREERILVEEAEKLESERQNLVSQLAADAYGQHFDLKAGEVLALAPTEEVAGALQRLTAELTQSVDEIKEQTDVNSVLLHSALEYVQAGLNRIGGVTVEPTYGNGGQDMTVHRRNYEFRA